MKRIYAGLAILAVLLSAAAAFSVLMERTHVPVAKALQEAATAAEDGDWAAAGDLFRSAQAQWQQHKQFTAAVADHSPMDDMDGLFAELEIYLRQQEMPHFSATCCHLAYLAEAMADNHALNWWNLL